MAIPALSCEDCILFYILYIFNNNNAYYWVFIPYYEYFKHLSFMNSFNPYKNYMKWVQTEYQHN